MSKDKSVCALSAIVAKCACFFLRSHPDCLTESTLVLYEIYAKKISFVHSVMCPLRASRGRSELLRPNSIYDAEDIPWTPGECQVLTVQSFL